MSRLEDDLRATLRRHAVDVDPVDGMPPEVRRRVQVRRGRTVGLAGMLAVALVLLGIGVVRSVQPDPSPPQPAPAPSTRLPLVEKVQVTPRTNGDLVYPLDGALVRRAPDGTSTSWVTRGDLNGACDVPGCELYDLVWSPDGSTLALTMGKIQRLSPSRLAVYVLADGATQPRKVLDCPEAICLDMQSPSLGWSPDGASLVISGDDFGTGLVVADVDESAAEARTVCEDCRATDAAWSPDGRWIAYASDDGIRRISTSGGPSELVSPEGGSDLTWSPDGTRLLVDSEDGVRVLDLSRRPYSEDMVVGLQKGEGPAAPAWSPDGTRVSWFSTPSESYRKFVAEVWTADWDGSRPTRLLLTGCCVSDWSAPVWSPDGQSIALGLSLDSRQPPDLIVLDAADGTELARDVGVGWGPMSWQSLP